MSRWVAVILIATSAVLMTRAEPDAALAVGWAVAAGLSAFALTVSPVGWRLSLGWISLAVAVVTATVAGGWAAMSAVAAAAALTVFRGRQWPGFSARYARGSSGTAEVATPRDMWESLDRGEDPTTLP